MWRILFLLPSWILFAEASAVYLSWYGDPSTTMTIQWLSSVEELGDKVVFEDADGNWLEASGQHVNLEQILVHTVALEGLAPDREYQFKIVDDSRMYRFKTAPDQLNEPLRFVIGGDVYLSKKLFRKMGQTVMKRDPLFAVLGGDLAYALSRHPFQGSPLRRWISFLNEWKETMITPEGRIVPFLVVPGNHDIATDNYELFFNLFAFPQKQLYRAIDFGSYMTLLLLDTGHFQPIEGRQTLWLEKALSTRTATPYRFAVYHEAAYPSHYPYQGVTPKKIRAHWIPLFEKYNLLAAFENHNHAFKRTYSIKAGQIAPSGDSGVIYLGDGGWGAQPRTTNDLWYLAKRSRKATVLWIEMQDTETHVEALDLANQAIDQITLYPNNK
ncbi:MAG: metallophosphoesterase family protein [Chlamydiales bacterium]